MKFITPKWYRTTNPSAGFTLVELMVSLSLFVIVVLATVSSLYSVNNASRKVQAMRSVIDNINFSVESISRTVRTSTDIGCDSVVNADCPFSNQYGSSQIVMSATLGQSAQVQYRRGTDPTTGNGRIEKNIIVNGVSSGWLALTSSEVNIQSLQFYVNGASTEDATQPSVMMFVTGVATAAGGDTVPFNIQTFISQRARD